MTTVKNLHAKVGNLFIALQFLLFLEREMTGYTKL